MSLVKALGDITPPNIDGSYYVGVVVNNKDPKNQFRCKIKVDEVYGDLPSDIIPWASQLRSTDVGSKTTGYFSTPKEGSNVVVIFPRGDYYNPIYTQSIVTKESGKSNVNYSEGETYYDDEVSTSIEKTKAQNYTTTKGKFKVDSGNNIELSASGNLTTNSSSSSKMTSGSSFSVSSGSTVNITAPGVITIKGSNIQVGSIGGGLELKNTSGGGSMVINNSGSILISDTNNSGITLDGDITIQGDVTVNGKINATGNIKGNQ